MFKVIKLAILITVSVKMLSSCGKPESRTCLKSSGGYSEITLQNIEAENIVLNDNLNLVLIQDSLNYLQISGGKNLVQLVSVISKEGVVELGNENKCEYLRTNDQITIAYHYDHIRSLTLNGYGQVKTKNPITDNIELYTNSSYSDVDLAFLADSLLIKSEVGSTSFNFIGQLNYYYAYFNGYGPFNAEKLISQHIHLHSNGLGDSYILPQAQVFIELRSKGDVYVETDYNPMINEIVSGSGKIIHQ